MIKILRYIEVVQGGNLTVQNQHHVTEPMELIMFEAMRERLENPQVFRQQTVLLWRGNGVPVSPCMTSHNEPWVFLRFSGGENCGWSIKALETASLWGRNLKWISRYREWFLVEVHLACSALSNSYGKSLHWAIHNNKTISDYQSIRDANPTFRKHSTFLLLRNTVSWYA